MLSLKLFKSFWEARFNKPKVVVRLNNPGTMYYNGILYISWNDEKYFDKAFYNKKHKLVGLNSQSKQTLRFDLCDKHYEEVSLRNCL